MRLARLIFSCLLAVALFTIPAQSRAQVAVGISVRIGPPALPVYVQPVCPEPDFIWIPGYWSYGPDGYFWVPGTWVEPPEVGLLWTPGYWAWADDGYAWHDGYWGPEVGFYGGINYGFGYTGVGFFGGYWQGREFFYNRAVTNVNVTVVHNTYNTTVVNNTTLTRVSFNGGPGGTPAKPTSREISAVHQRHFSMTPQQSQHLQAASTNRTLLASVNHGRPDVAASARPGQFENRGAVETGRPVSPGRPQQNSKEMNRSVNPPPAGEGSNSNRPPSLRTPSPSPNPALEQKHQQEQDRLRQQQAQERQRVEQKHQQEQQKLQQHAADDRKRIETQRKQQQQLQQLDRKHEQQQQKLEQKQQQERQRQQKPEKPPAQSKPTRNEKQPS